MFGWMRRSARPIGLSPEEQRLVREIRQAQADWEDAYLRLDYVEGADQIDFAIYALEAAEKRYEMLLRQAKLAKLSLWNKAEGRVWHVPDAQARGTAGGVR